MGRDLGRGGGGAWDRLGGAKVGWGWDLSGLGGGLGGTTSVRGRGRSGLGGAWAGGGAAGGEGSGSFLGSAESPSGRRRWAQPVFPSGSAAAPAAAA